MGCCSHAGFHDVYKKRSDRRCTDVVCLLALLGAWGAVGGIIAASISKDSSLLYSLIYPKDAYGQWCGLTSSVDSKTHMMYPVINDDLTAMASTIAGYSYSEYYKVIQDLRGLCVEECPNTFNFSNPNYFGGPGYPTPSSCTSDPGSGDSGAANCNLPIPTPLYSSAYLTYDVLGYCIPYSSTYTSTPKTVCTNPACSAADGRSCTDIPTNPDITTAWEVCPPGSDATSSACTVECVDGYEFQVEYTATIEPVNTTSSTSVYIDYLSSYIATVASTWDSFVVAWTPIWLAGVLFPVLLGIVWLVLLYLFAGVIVYTLLIVLIICLWMLTIICATKAGVVPSSVVDSATAYANSSTVAAYSSVASGTDQYYYLIGFALTLILTVVVCIFICMSCKALRRAVTLIEECTRALRSVPILILAPLPGLFLQIGFLFLGLFGLFFVVYPTTWTTADGTQDTNTVIVLALIVTGGILWTLEFIWAISFTSTSATVAHWFVEQGEHKSWCETMKTICMGCGLGKWLDATWTILFKHMGSMAFGSLLIATCQLIRLCLTAFDHYTKEQQKANFLLKLAMKCAQYAMWCLQKSIEFVSHYAYINVGIEGVSFCTGCADTFKLICTYPAQTAINAIIKNLLKMLIGWSIPTICAAGAWYYLDSWTFEEDCGKTTCPTVVYSDTYNVLCPTVTVFAIAYFIANGITVSLTCCLDTIFLCAYKDMQENKPPKFMSDALRAAFNAAKNEAGRSAAKYQSADAKKNGDAVADTVEV
jgi:hypothetical protein